MWRLAGDGLRCWLCLIRAAVKLGLEIILQQIKSTVAQPGGVKTFFQPAASQLSSLVQLSIIASSEVKECSIKWRFFYLMETGHFSDRNMT